MKLSRIRCRVSLLFLSLLATGLSFAQDTSRAVSQKSGDLSGTPSPDILDSLIAIVIILFILSVIVEKITQLIRKYSPFIKPSQPKLHKTAIASVWRNINKKQTGDSKDMDKKIEREVNSLSFMIGLLIAVAFRVDLFKMIRVPDPRSVLFWSQEAKYSTLEMLLFVLSIGLTGFFLTFGSKFFHDLLDMLFQVKNLKRKMADDNTYEAENIEQFDEYLEKSYTSIIDTAIQQNQNILSPSEATAPPMHGKMMKNGRVVDCIDVHVSAANRGSIPLTVQAKMEKGQIIVVPVNVITDVDLPDAHFRQGDAIANAASADFKGTICCKLRRNADDRECVLTCSHVMTGGTAANSFGELDPEIAAVISNVNGNFIWALFNDRFDVALADPLQQPFQYRIRPGKERTVSAADVLTTRIKVVRQQGREISHGHITNHRALKPITIKYSDGEFGLNNLIVLSRITNDGQQNNHSTLTAEGDSGACVYDEDERPIGMIVAGNRKFSYAIPIVDILTKTNSSLIV